VRGKREREPGELGRGSRRRRAMRNHPGGESLEEHADRRADRRNAERGGRVVLRSAAACAARPY